MEPSQEKPDNRDHELMPVRLRLAAIVESSDDAIIGKDINGIITDWNNAAERLYGYSADEVIGQPISILVPSDRLDDFAEIMRKIRAGESVTHFETVRRKKNGTHLQVSVTVSPLVDADGRIIGASEIARDISERKLQEQALRQKERELAEAQRLAGVGSWHHDARNDIVTWSEELYRIAGLDPAFPAPAYPDLHNVFRAESWERLNCAVEQALRDGTAYELDLEMVRPDGTARSVKAHGEAVSDTASRIVALRGTAQDITERKRAEEVIASMGRKLLEAQEQERARIARELHDNINQQLALLSVEIQQMKERLPASDEELRNQMDALHKQASKISDDIQSLSHELHSSKLEYLGLTSAMKSFCREFADKHNATVHFDSEGVRPATPQEIALCLFRIMQEGLRNALKHSGVQTFEVKLNGSPKEIRLTVRDSGVGFEPELVKDTQGLGLLSMRERVRLVNGTFSITSSPHSGTEINICVPLLAGTCREQTRSTAA